MNLSELIAEQKGSRTYDELARDCGRVLSDKRLQQMVKGSINEFPKPSTVRGLAAGLRVSQNAVVLAAAESLGLDVRGRGRLIEHMPSSASRLSDETAGHLLALVHSIVPASKEEGEGHDRPAATTEAPRGADNVVHLPTGERKYDPAAKSTDEPALNEQAANRQDADAEAPDPEGPPEGT